MDADISSVARRLGGNEPRWHTSSDQFPRRGYDGLPDLIAVDGTHSVRHAEPGHDDIGVTNSLPCVTRPGPRFYTLVLVLLATPAPVLSAFALIAVLVPTRARTPHPARARAASGLTTASAAPTAAPLALLHVASHLPVEAGGDVPATHEQRAADAMTDRIDLPQGTLDLLILKSLSLGAQHGWAISERIRQVTGAALEVPQGSLYPALHRLERRGWIRASWGTSDNNRKAKYYQLTRVGTKQFAAGTAAWAKLTEAVQHVLRMA